MCRSPGTCGCRSRPATSTWGSTSATGDLEALAKDKVTIDATPGFGYYYIALNMKDPDLQKPLVRRAFQHMLDWKALAQTTMRFNGYPWQSTIPKGMPGAPADPAPDFTMILHSPRSCWPRPAIRTA